MTGAAEYRHPPIASVFTAESFRRFCRRTFGGIAPAEEAGRETGPMGPVSTTYCVRFSDDLNVLGLKALVALDDVELDLLPFDKRAISVHGDLGVMNEDVVSALSLDKTEPLLVCEPLDGALSQHFLLEPATARAPSRRALIEPVKNIPAASRKQAVLAGHGPHGPCW